MITESKQELIKKLETHKKRIERERIEAENSKLAKKEEKAKAEEIKKEINDLSSDVKIASLNNRLDKIEKELTHRELFDNELRESISLAAQKRVDASFRDLIDAVDKMKKHINIIDGVDNGDAAKIIVVPGEIVNRYNIQSPQVTNLPHSPINPSKIIDIKTEDNDNQTYNPNPNPTN